MSLEKQGYVPLDKSWINTFEQIGNFESYTFFDDTAEKRGIQKQQFVSGEIRNPVLEYPKLDLTKLEEIETNLVDLKKKVLANEPNEDVKWAYRWRINEKIAEVRLLKAAASTPPDMKSFKRYSEFVFGKPSHEVFITTIQSLRSQASSALESDNADLVDAAMEFLKVLPSNPQGPTNLIPPTKTELDLFKQQTTKEFGDLLQAPPLTEPIKAEQIRDAFTNALEVLRLEGWSVEIDTSSKSSISVNQQDRKVVVPESRELDNKTLRGLLVHEIGTHVSRRERGGHSKLALLGLGLDRYEGGEEGVATAREDSISPPLVEDFSGIAGHFAIGLAYGLDGKPRDFRDVYEILLPYYRFSELNEGKEKSVAFKEAETKAWNRAVRTFRGTDCNTPGVAFTKDIIYREGNIGVWNVIRHDPEEVVNFSLGKYDPTNLRHLYLLTKFGVTDSDLS